MVPAAPQAAQGSLFERIFGWFKKRGEESAAAETAPAAEPVAAIARSERPSERRGERERKPGQRRGRGEGRGEPRNGETRQQEPRQSEGRESRETRETRGSEQPKQPRPPRQPKPRPEAEVAPRTAETADAPREAGAEEKRESRSRRGRGNRRPRDARPDAAEAGSTVAPHAVIETAGFHAVIEIARKPKATPAPAAVTAPAQQALQLETVAAPSAPLPGAVTASPATILADLATSKADLQQVETQGVGVDTAERSEPSRSHRRRRPAVKAEAEAVSLMQVETTAPVTSVTEMPASAETAPHPTRRRTRPQVTPPQEPLVQVETQSK